MMRDEKENMLHLFRFQKKIRDKEDYKLQV